MGKNYSFLPTLDRNTMVLTHISIGIADTLRQDVIDALLQDSIEVLLNHPTRVWPQKTYVLEPLKKDSKYYERIRDEIEYLRDKFVMDTSSTLPCTPFAYEVVQMRARKRFLVESRGSWIEHLQWQPILGLDKSNYMMIAQALDQESKSAIKYSVWALYVHVIDANEFGLWKFVPWIGVSGTKPPRELYNGDAYAGSANRIFTSTNLGHCQELAKTITVGSKYYSENNQNWCRYLSLGLNHH